MSNTRVALSARAVQEYLAGRMSIEEFQRLHRWEPNDPESWKNPFEAALERGATIAAANIFPGGDHDDDWIEFEWNENDPAISPFR
jgi:hypothetical protein